MKSYGKGEERQLITSVYESRLSIDSAILENLRGSLISMEPFVPAIFTIQEDEPEQPVTSIGKADDCCERANRNPECLILGTSLTADFSQFEVKIFAAHPCGIRSIGGHICTVTYVEGDLIVRHCITFTTNGTPVVDGKEYPCPTDQQTRIETLRFPTRDLLGIRFMARIKVASCCNEEHDTSVCWLNTSDKFII